MIDDFRPQRPPQRSAMTGRIITPTHSVPVPPPNTRTRPEATHPDNPQVKRYDHGLNRHKELPAEAPRPPVHVTKPHSHPSVKLEAIHQRAEKKAEAGQFGSQASQAENTPAYTAVSRKTHTATAGLHMKSRTRKHARTTKVVMTYVAAGLAVVGISRLHLPYIDIICLSYGAVALILKLDSRLSLIGTLMAIVYMAIAQALQYQQLSDTVALIAFYLLCTGVAATIIENRSQMKSVVTRAGLSHTARAYRQR